MVDSGLNGCFLGCDLKYLFLACLEIVGIVHMWVFVYFVNISVYL